MLAPIVTTFRPLIFNNVFSYTLTTDQTLAANFTFVQKVLPAAFASGGDYCRITLAGGAGGPLIVTACYIALSAKTGNAWNSQTQTQVTFSGGNFGVTVGAGATATSDTISFPINGSGAISIAMNVSTTSRAKYATASTNFTAYYKSGVSEAHLTSRGASYTASASRIRIVSAVTAAS